MNTAIDADLANDALRALSKILNDSQASPEPIEVTIDGDPKIIKLPRSVGEILRQILTNAAAGRTVSVIPDHAELTTQQAADLLGVSRPYLINLVDQGLIRHHKVGTHRRIHAASVHDYQQKMRLDSEHAADELTELTEELGLY